jgi:hypothetical protein
VSSFPWKSIHSLYVAAPGELDIFLRRRSKSLSARNQPRSNRWASPGDGSAEDRPDLLGSRGCPAGGPWFGRLRHGEHRARASHNFQNLQGMEDSSPVVGFSPRWPSPGCVRGHDRVQIASLVADDRLMLGRTNTQAPGAFRAPHRGGRGGDERRGASRRLSGNRPREGTAPTGRATRATPQSQIAGSPGGCLGKKA